jgi:hypothetical protein
MIDVYLSAVALGIVTGYGIAVALRTMRAVVDD